jgi:hypothetical protein
MGAGLDVAAGFITFVGSPSTPIVSFGHNIASVSRIGTGFLLVVLSPVLANPARIVPVVTPFAGTNIVVTAESTPTGPNTAAVEVSTFSAAGGPGVAVDISFYIHVDILP